MTAVLQNLMDGPGEPLVIRLERQPGQKEARYRQQISELDRRAARPNATAAQPLKVAMSLPPEVEERLQ